MKKIIYFLVQATKKPLWQVGGTHLSIVDFGKVLPLFKPHHCGHLER
jgi:hypothetical protein